MHPSSTGSRPHGRGRPLRRLIGAALGATAATALFMGTSASAAPEPAAPVVLPQRMDGDRQSANVAATATSALYARDVWAYTRVPAAHRTYAEELDATAVAVASEFRVDPNVVRDAWDAADLEHQTAVLAGLSELGTSYQTASSSPGVSFDCSGLTAYAWSRTGVTLARQSTSQINAARSLDRESAVAGDIVRYPGHVMLYLGFGDAIVHAANHESDVELSTVPDGRSVRWGDPTG